jgi:hypothetical protein
MAEDGSGVARLRWLDRRRLSAVLESVGGDPAGAQTRTKEHETKIFLCVEGDEFFFSLFIHAPLPPAPPPPPPPLFAAARSVTRRGTLKPPAPPTP